MKTVMRASDWPRSAAADDRRWSERLTGFDLPGGRERYGRYSTRIVVVELSVPDLTMMPIRLMEYG